MTETECRSLDSLPDAIIRNGWYVPPRNSPCVNIHYLHKVRFNKVWCPKFCEVRLAPCPKLPAKQAII